VRYAANSEFVKQRVRRAWGVEAEVLHPPIAVSEIRETLTWRLPAAETAVLKTVPESFILGASRLVDYKRIDLVIKLAHAIGLPAVVVGSGPDEARLRAYASEIGADVRFLGRVSDRLLYELYRLTELFAFLAVEDFGIMPLEAVAAGAPVLVNSEGGASEAVLPTGAGLAVEIQDFQALRAAAESAIALKGLAKTSSVDRYSNERFRQRFLEWVTPAR